MNHLVLAGGGHAHALLLRHWAMKPKLKPHGLITLVTEHSSVFYSGMVPGFVAGYYQENEITIDLRALADQAKVCFVQAKVVGIDINNSLLRVFERPPIGFDFLSLNLGSVTKQVEDYLAVGLIPVKPLKPALQYIAANDDVSAEHHSDPFSVVGSGFAGIEISLALRTRWPKRTIILQAGPGGLTLQQRKVLSKASIQINELQLNQPPATGLLCTGSCAPTLLVESGFLCDEKGRIKTLQTLQTLGHANIFACGDCAVVESNPRPASGVWAVRSAPILIDNLQRAMQNQQLRRWRPQRFALQLLGLIDSEGNPSAICFWGPIRLGPYRWLWSVKSNIDAQFMKRFSSAESMGISDDSSMACRGCAAKLAAAPLAAALHSAGLKSTPEDAAELDSNWLQSVDGFPALVSDPWLNGRLTALHASSDLWACGIEVTSAQAIVTLPETSAAIQEQLLSQVLEGIQSAIKPQGGRLIGGHTMETRDSTIEPISLGVQINLCVNGRVNDEIRPWSKGGFQVGDVLLLSRPLGTGVLFAAASVGASKPSWTDQVLETMQSAQTGLVKVLRRQVSHDHDLIRCCTDITGFGLLGHLGEMLDSSQPNIQVILDSEAIPSYEGCLELFKKGFASSLAPANRKAWNRLKGYDNNKEQIKFSTKPSDELLELLVDPQTCGPLLIACQADLAESLVLQTPLMRIGEVVASD